MTMGSSDLNGTPISTRALFKAQELSQKRRQKACQKQTMGMCAVKRVLGTRMTAAVGHSLLLWVPAQDQSREISQHANCTQWVTRNKTEEGRHFRVSKGSRDHSAYDQDTLFTSMKLSKNK